MNLRADGRIRVVIADDTADVRALLQYTLDLDGRFEVVAQAENGVEAVAAAEAEHPDAVVLDVAMPVMDGLVAIPHIKRVAPDARIVLLSCFGARQMEEQAIAAGAAAYVEKTTFDTLTSVLVEVCQDRPTPRPTAPASSTAAAPPTPAPAAPPPRLAVSADRMPAPVRQARWCAVVFTLIQFLLYSPPHGTTVPFPKVPVGLLVAAVLAAVNLVTKRRVMPRAALAVDTAVVLTVLFLFSFEGSSSLWTLLLVVVIEGAMCCNLAGALAVWAAAGTVNSMREVWASHHYPIAGTTVESVTFQLGILLLVALTTGHLARNSARTSEEHLRAREESERRAALLGIVAQAGRSLAALDSDELISAVVDATVALGFEGVELCTREVKTGTWHVRRQRGLREEVDPLDTALADAARLRQSTVLVADGDTAELGAPWLAAGYQSVVATPIRAGHETVAALIGGRQADHSVTASEVECLELLAAQAGVGLANVRVVDRVRHQALHDALTGLPNQVLFEDRVAQALSHAGRTSKQAAVMFVDLDRFKKVNDTLGHDFGNELLRQVAGRLLGAVRSDDTVARMGGDEFTLLLPNLADGGDAAVVAGKVIESLRAPFTVAGHELFVTASVGIAVYPHDGLRYETLLKHADIAMYRSKAAGANTFELYGARRNDPAAYPRLSLESDLHNALARDELRIVYQPQIDLALGRVRGVEALVRWDHPSLGLILPDEFVPLAEEAGLIAAIDLWVLERACETAVEWRKSLGPTSDFRLAVNVSARHLQHPRFAELVLAALTRSGLAASALEIEVTEGAAVGDVVEVRDVLARLRETGVRVAIDDFGTGYSMLSRLKDFPLDTLKIDRSFIAEIDDASAEAPIVSATIAMARSLGLEVVAEGVEVDAQLRFLRRAGCDVVQGYLLGYPVEADAVIDLIAHEVITVG